MNVLTNLVRVNRPDRKKFKRSFWEPVCLLMPTALLVTLVAVGGVSAAGRIGFVVNNTGNGYDSTPGNGVCEAGALASGVCTLRAAIDEANANANTDVRITFDIPTSDPGYNAQTGAWTILGPNLADLSRSSRSELITRNISGPGADKLIIDQGGNKRVFNVTTTGTVSFSGLTIVHGRTTNGESGAAIQNVRGGTVNITNCTLRDNESSIASSSFGGGGGAICNASTGTINVTNSTLTLNRALAPDNNTASGGGIYNKTTGIINVRRSTLDHNSGSLGGGIFNQSGIVNVSDSTFHDNSASYVGGGIGNAGGTLSVTNSTLYANIAHQVGPAGRYGIGGGIANQGGTLNLTNSTLNANFSGIAGSGLYNNNPNGAVANVKSTIVAGNYGGTIVPGGAPDVFGTFVSQGFNFIGKRDGSTGFTAATDKKGTIAAPQNPKLDIRASGIMAGPQ